MRKRTFAYDAVADHMGLSSFVIRYCFLNLQYSPKIRTYNSSMSSKAVDIGANRKRIYNYLLVTTRRYGRIYYRFRDIDV